MIGESRWVYLLLVVGLSQMTGEVTGIRALRGIGAATGASPAPKVFSTVDGLETFSTRFSIAFDTGEGRQEVAFDAEQYGRLSGPYNRRNPYGALLAYGPVLKSDPRTAPMFWAAARYALCGDRPLLSEIGLDPAEVEGRVEIHLAPRAGTAAHLETRFEVPCS